MKLQVNAQLHLQDLVFDNTSTLPSKPKAGQLCVVDGIPQLYTEIDGEMGWFILGQKQSYYVHKQEDVSKQWNVEHNMGIIDFIYHIYDENGNVMIADMDIINDNTIQINLMAASTGRVVLFGASDSYVGYIKPELGITGESFSYGSTPPGPEVNTELYFQLDY
jgi:hypothetical protein